MSEKIVLAKLDLDTDELIKSAAETKRKIDELRAAQKGLSTDTAEGREQFVKNAAEIKKLNVSYQQQTKAVSGLISENGTLLKTEDALNIALSAEVKSINDATRQNAELKKIRNEVNVTTDEGRKAYDAINAKIKQNDEFVKSNVSELEQQKIGIGGYAQSIKDALKNTGLFNGVIDENTKALEPVKIGFQFIKKEVDNVRNSFGQSSATIVTNTASTIQNTGATEARTAVGFQLNQTNTAQATSTNAVTVAQRAQTIATNATSASLKILRLALIATGVGAFVVVLGSLIAFLSTTQAGIDKITSVLRPLQAIAQSILGVIQNLGKSLFETFSNPKQALIDLVDLIKNNLLNRLKAFGVILDGILNLDFKQISNGFLQATTGVENLTDKVQKAGQNTAKFFADAAKRGAEIDRLTKEIEKSEINLNKQRAIAESREKDLQLIARDTSRNAAEREKAAREIIEIKREEAQREAAILQLRIERLKVEQELNDTNREGNKELANLEAELIKINDAAKTAELEQIRVISAARKEEQQKANEARKKAVDDSIKEQNALLELFKQQQGIRAKELQEQLKIDEEVSRKRLEILQLEFKNGKKSKTEFEAEKLSIENEFQQRQIEIQTQLAERILQNEIKQLDAVKREKVFFSEEILQIEIDRFTKIAELQTEFERQRLENGVITETQFQDAISKIQQDFQTRKDSAQAEREKADAEKQKLDLENRRFIEDAIFQEDLLILQQRLELQRLAEVEAAEKTGADLALINQKYAIKRNDLEKKNAEMRKQAQLLELRETLGFFGNLAGALQSLFGENKAFAAATALINGGLAVTEILATKSILPEPLASINRGFQIATAIGTTANSIRQINSAKFEKGGLMSIGGKRHNAGGTKFVGEDGTRFEAEKGELIGVLNRGAASTFMAFNNMFGRGKMGTNFAEQGGVISRNINSDASFNIELLAQALANMRPPVVQVQSILDESRNFVDVTSIADF
jgi:hypothetical protein